QILSWADDHRRRTGRWPTPTAGPVPAAPGEVWANVQQALSKGLRVLPGGDSPAGLLARQRGRRTLQPLPPLTEAKNLRRARAPPPRGEAGARGTGPAGPRLGRGAAATAPARRAPAAPGPGGRFRRPGAPAGRECVTKGIAGRRGRPSGGSRGKGQAPGSPSRP